jgi:hypothetical protein
VWISNYLSEQDQAYVAVMIYACFAELISDGRKPINREFAKGSNMHIKSPQIIRYCPEMKQ